jgi:hypothetical protein
MRFRVSGNAFIKIILVILQKRWGGRDNPNRSAAGNVLPGYKSFPKAFYTHWSVPSLTIHAKT